jgi:hypothetical protein
LATIWKNGVAATLPGYHSIGLTGVGQYAVSTYADYVSALFVSGNDVYVAGGSRYWGNNARCNVSASCNLFSEYMATVDAAATAIYNTYTAILYR